RTLPVDAHDLAPLEVRRQALYQEARNRIPTRWSGNTCNWTLAGAVTLNPERVQEPQSLKGAA
ncbi:hypothetical protein FV194_33000, partial [Pseudomonas aeruginosa]|nr:hypothetical protein [Pseudomonas aeruginosa]